MISYDFYQYLQLRFQAILDANEIRNDAKRSRIASSSFFAASRVSAQFACARDAMVSMAARRTSKYPKSELAQISICSMDFKTSMASLMTFQWISMVFCQCILLEMNAFHVEIRGAPQSLSSRHLRTAASTCVTGDPLRCHGLHVQGRAARRLRGEARAF